MTDNLIAMGEARARLRREIRDRVTVDRKDPGGGWRWKWGVQGGGNTILVMLGRVFVRIERER